MLGSGGGDRALWGSSIFLFHFVEGIRAKAVEGEPRKYAKKQKQNREWAAESLVSVWLNLSEEMS